MKNTLLLGCLLAAVSVHADNNWFIRPNIAFVQPMNVSATYYGYDGYAQFKNGYSIGVMAGRNGFPWEFISPYISYDYTSFNAKSLTLHTPIGESVNTQTDLYHTHTVTAGAIFAPTERTSDRYLGGVRPFMRVGIGRTFNDAQADVIDTTAGLARRVLGGELSVEAGRRWTDGTIQYAHRSFEQPSFNLLSISYKLSF